MWGEFIIANFLVDPSITIQLCQTLAERWGGLPRCYRTSFQADDYRFKVKHSNTSAGLFTEKKRGPLATIWSGTGSFTRLRGCTRAVVYIGGYSQDGTLWKRSWVFFLGLISCRPRQLISFPTENLDRGARRMFPTDDPSDLFPPILFLCTIFFLQSHHAALSCACLCLKYCSPRKIYI